MFKWHINTEKIYKWSSASAVQLQHNPIISLSRFAIAKFLGKMLLRISSGEGEEGGGLLNKLEGTSLRIIKVQIQIFNSLYTYFHQKTKFHFDLGLMKTYGRAAKSFFFSCIFPTRWTNAWHSNLMSVIVRILPPPSPILESYASQRSRWCCLFYCVLVCPLFQFNNPPAFLIRNFSQNLICCTKWWNRVSKNE